MKSKLPILSFIILLAICIRLVGLSYGLPNLYHVDEAQVVFDGARFHPNVLFRPLAFSVYGPLMSYVINFFFILYGLVLLIVGKVSNSTDLYLLFETNKTPFFLIARSISLVIQIITIFFVYRLADVFFKSKISGLFAALFLSLSVGYLGFGRIAEPESLTALICTLAVFFAYRIARGGKLIDYILLGLSIGLAVSSKYNAYLFTILIPLAHFLYCSGNKGWLKKFVFEKKFYLSFVFLVLGVFLGHPPLWLRTGELFNALFNDPGRIISIIYPSYSYAASALKTGWMGKSIQSNPFWIFKAILINERTFGYLVFAGIIFSMIRRKLIDVLLLFLVAVYLLVISTYTRIGNDIHYLFPIFPIFALLVGRLMAEALSLIRNRFFQPVFLVIIFYFIFLPIVKIDITSAKNLTKKDTRTIARNWIEKNIAWGTKIAVVPYAPELLDPEMDLTCSFLCNHEKLRPKLWDYAKYNPWYRIVAFRYRAAEPVWPETWLEEKILKYQKDPYVSGQYALVYRDCDFLVNEKIEYLVLSSGMYGRYFKENIFPLTNPLFELFERDKKTYEEILSGRSFCLSEIKEVELKEGIVGPEIKIYKVIPNLSGQNQRQ